MSKNTYKEETLETINTPLGKLEIKHITGAYDEVFDKGELALSLTRPNGQEITFCYVAHIAETDVLEIASSDDYTWDNHHRCYVVPLK